MRKGLDSFPLEKAIHVPPVLNISITRHDSSLFQKAGNIPSSVIEFDTVYNYKVSVLYTLLTTIDVNTKYTITKISSLYNCIY